MMLCKSDFEELFPTTVKTVDECVHEAHLSPVDDCIARWKDDGGSVHILPARKHEPEKRQARNTTVIPEAMRSGFAFAAMPAAISVGFSSAILRVVHGRIFGEERKLGG